MKIIWALLAVMFLLAASRCVGGLGGRAPTVLTKDITRLESVLENIAFTSPEMISGGQSLAANDAVMYQVSFRTCPPCIQSHENILPKLQAAGIETRLVTTARQSRSTDKERAAVVENARRKDWSFTQKWWTGRNPNRFYAKIELPIVEGDAAREAELVRLQNHVAELSQVLAQNGREFAFPTLIWLAKDGRYKAAVGYNPALTAQIISEVKGE